MGMQTTMEENRYSYLLKNVNAFPATPMMSDDEWALIKEYYTVLSEDSLTNPKTLINDEDLTLFEAIKVRMPDAPPQTCMVKFGNENDIYFGHALDGKLNRYNLTTESFSTIDIQGAASQLDFTNEGFRVLSMGDFPPNNRREGMIYEINDSKIQDTVLTKLLRAVDMQFADLNEDGLDDIVVSNFGFVLGSLDWFEASDEGYIEHRLRDLPGAIKSQVTDLNGDGHLDILALMAQGDEGFFLYTGNGDGSFDENQIMQFPSTYGSSYFELVDFNDDGLKDILYINGDNGDYSSPVYKPYHGLRIFLNTTTDTVSFSEAYFYHFNGGFRAITNDYDLDGDLDIACISHFPDYNSTPEESFIYLENTGDGLQFEPKSIKEAYDGKWLVMDAADYDLDGDIDLVLGSSPLMSLADPVEFQSIWSKDPINLMILRNTIR